MTLFPREKSLQQEVFNNNKIKVIWNAEIRNAFGENKLERVLVENLKTTKEQYKINVDGYICLYRHGS